jgi:phytoene dehydrogenase-like protein
MADSEPYDFAVIGTGIGGLAIASLLAHSGRSVILFDRHYLPGGYGQTFGAGRFLFCAELHYVWDCGPGERVFRFLQHLGLEEQVKFRRLNPDGFDRVVAPGIDYTIGSGYARECERLSRLFPGHTSGLQRYYEILTTIYNQAYQLPLGYSWRTLLRHPWKYSALIRYLGWTLQDLFDLLGFPQPLQLILAGQSAIFFLPPKQLSLIIHAAGVTSYDRGACVPEQSFRQLIHALVDVVRHQADCRVALSTEITKIHVSDNQATAVTTHKGETIAARHVIYDGDPQRSLDLIGPEKFPARFRRRLSYEYSTSALSVYLGLSGIELRDFGFGDENLFWYPAVDLNAVYDRQFADSIPEEPYFFCDAPTLRMRDPKLAPPGCQQLVMVSPCRYDFFRRLRQQSEEAYQAAKQEYAARIIRILERDFIPGLSKHIETQVVGSPLTNEYFVGAPHGNCYGMPLDPDHQNAFHLNFRSPFANLFYVGTTSGMPGMAPNIHFSTLLYERLTGDCFYTERRSH